MTPAVHKMKLAAPYFLEIASGKKTVELRLYDRKRQGIHVGDTIIFTKNDKDSESLSTTVTDVTIASSFAELLKKIPTGAAGSVAQTPSLLRAFYNEGQEKLHGVVAIHIRKL